jgi:hypothetical protein
MTSCRRAPTAHSCQSKVSTSANLSPLLWHILPIFHTLWPGHQAHLALQARQGQRVTEVRLDPEDRPANADLQGREVQLAPKQTPTKIPS